MPHHNQKIFDEGWRGWADGARFDENPYVLHLGRWAISEPNTPAGAWADGWLAAEEDHEHQESERDAYNDRADWEYDRRD